MLSIAVGALVIVGIGGVVVLSGDEPDAIATFNAPATTASTTTIPPTVTNPPVTTPPTTVAPSTTAAPVTTQAPTTTAAPSTTEIEFETVAAEPAAPIAPPADPQAAEAGPQIGAISIPRIGLNTPMLSGIRMTTLDRGPGHWPGTAMPGEPGNVVVAAHRTSHNAEFRSLDDLSPGDEVVFTTNSGAHTYRVNRTEIVNPDAVWIVNPTETPTATLFACHPPGSVRQRIVVFLDLVA